MFGRLARELRLAGIDCEHDRNLGGMAAYRVARQRGRILITRANRLRELPGVVFISTPEPAEQVTQVKSAIEAGLAPAVPVDEPRPEPSGDSRPQPRTEPIPALNPVTVSPEPGPVPQETTESDGQLEMAMLAPLPLPLPQAESPRRENRHEPRRERAPRHQRDRRPQRTAPQSAPQRPTAAAEPGVRCSTCGVVLEKITREQARPVVPFFTFQIHHDFRRCPKCRKVFWPGSHVPGTRGQVDDPPAARHPRGRRGPRR